MPASDTDALESALKKPYSPPSIIDAQLLPNRVNAKDPAPGNTAEYHSHSSESTS